MSYSLTEAANLIISDDFNKSSGKSMYKALVNILEGRGILDYCNNKSDKYHYKKYVYNWNTIRFLYPNLYFCFEDFYTDKGYYQPKIHVDGIEMLKKSIYVMDGGKLYE